MSKCTPKSQKARNELYRKSSYSVALMELRSFSISSVNKLMMLVKAETIMLKGKAVPSQRVQPLWG